MYAIVGYFTNPRRLLQEKSDLGRCYLQLKGSIAGDGGGDPLDSPWYFGVQIITLQKLDSNLTNYMRNGFKSRKGGGRHGTNEGLAPCLTFEKEMHG